MFCTRCGSELSEQDRFCGHCGKPTDPEYVPPTGTYRPRLSRSIEGKKIAGVCAGFARYLDVDPTLVRVIWLALAFGTGVGFIAYLIAWIVMPKDTPAPMARTAEQRI